MESLTGIGSLSPIGGMAMSEVVFGGVGSGIYGMLVFVLLAVFVGGLMVGRTPEFLGKKIEAREMKLATLAILVTPLAVLLAAGLALGTDYGAASIFAAGKPQGFSETLYAYLSQANNNGSAFAGYTGFIQPEAGSVGRLRHHVRRHHRRVRDARRALPADAHRPGDRRVARRQAPGAGRAPARCAPTRRRSALLLGFVVFIVGALTFLPALLLGPLAQGLTDRLF